MGHQSLIPLLLVCQGRSLPPHALFENSEFCHRRPKQPIVYLGHYSQPGRCEARTCRSDAVRLISSLETVQVETTHSEKIRKVLRDQSPAIGIAELRPYFLEDSHVLSSDRPRTRQLCDIREAFHHHT